MQFGKLWYLQRFNLFQEFTEAELLAVVRVMDLRALERHEQVFQAGAPADRVYFLKEGRVKISRRGRFGRKVTLAILKPGEVFGEGAFTAGAVHEHEAEALETSIICVMTTSEFRALLHRKPALALRVLQNLSQWERLLEQRIADLVFKDVPTRLAETLLALGEYYCQPCAHGLGLELVITQQDLADLIGATRPVVNAALKQFERRGLISLHRQFICFADRDGLRRLAASSGSTS
jgi:CRP/FNR family transcriptional regulator, cyclic AMP receptor protein